MILKQSKKSLLILSALLLSGCSSSYESILQQSENIQGTYINAGAITTNEVNRGFWWKQLNNEKLNKDIEILLSQNLDLLAASERITQARTRISQNRGAFFPSINANASASRSFQNSVAQGISGDFGSERFFNTNYSPQLQTSWELDLFGRIRNSVGAAQSQFKASKFDKQALAQSLIVQLINTQVDIRTQKTLLEITKEIAYNRSQAYEMIKRRYDLGLEETKLSSVYLAKDRLASAQADTYQYETQLQNALNAYDLLLGQQAGKSKADDFDLDLKASKLKPALCLPSSLIDDRPDLKASRERISAADANINIAMADLYPNLNLSGALGFSGNETRNLFSAEQLAGSILGALTAPLFQGGALRANVKIRESEAKELSYSYAQQILEAITEVENALKAESNLGKQLQDIESSIYALNQSEENTYNRYINGIEKLQSVLEAQQSRLLAQQRKTIALREKWNARLSLNLALGGQWFNDKPQQCDRKNLDLSKEGQKENE